MRLFSSKVPPVAQEITKTLVSAGDLETERGAEVEADLASVLNQYLAAEKDVNEKTKDLLSRTGRGEGEFSRVRAQIAESKGIKVGEDMLDYVLDQLVEMLHYSSNVEEIFAEDVAMRRKMAVILKRHMQADQELDVEVRTQLKHVKEGTRTWDIEYARVMEATRRKRGLS